MSFSSNICKPVREKNSFLLDQGDPGVSVGCMLGPPQSCSYVHHEPQDNWTLCCMTLHLGQVCRAVCELYGCCAVAHMLSPQPPVPTESIFSWLGIWIVISKCKCEYSWNKQYRCTQFSSTKPELATPLFSNARCWYPSCWMLVPKISWWQCSLCCREKCEVAFRVQIFQGQSELVMPSVAQNSSSLCAFIGCQAYWNTYPDDSQIPSTWRNSVRFTSIFQHDAEVKVLNHNFVSIARNDEEPECLTPIVAIPIGTESNPL